MQSASVPAIYFPIVNFWDKYNPLRVNGWETLLPCNQQILRYAIILTMRI